MTEPSDVAPSQHADSEEAGGLLASYLRDHCSVPDNGWLLYDDPHTIAAYALRWMRENAAAAELPELPEHDMAGFTEMLNEYTRIAAKAFAASRLTDAAGDPIYSDYQDWYQNGDWHAAIEEAEPS